MFTLASFAQSSLSDHPTPITTNEIAGTIKARDLGDARLTTHYYWFEGSQGDVFINLTSKNFAGDIDVFVENGSKSLTKIVVYADFGEVETGRVIYLRKPEKLLLRVQGRTPSDESATYRLKFAGSFVAAVADDKDIPAMPIVGENVGGAVRVNSVGTILPPLPKVVESKATAETVAPDKKAGENEQAENDGSKEKINEAKSDEAKAQPKLEVVVEEPKIEKPAKSTTVSNRTTKRGRNTRQQPTKSTQPTPEVEKKSEPPSDEAKAASEVPVAKNPRRSTTAKTGSNPAPKSELIPDPLANVRLVIVFKDGSRIERPLPDVFKFSVDRGMLTVISKDGRVGKYQMIDVASVTIQ
jgi:hypothetical protein